ncbi:Hypothetical predicted protein [Mytilus galloprovincialis]|uniref:DDE Tnp4 domain-containing protein n=1 Tax=Mytilus galloprovincialis TaxID=29158 RepID=A0A8B6H7V2_MYTGA|nr:Hypothetical predicted protein [Mytilus galloprovincialis]
MTELRREDRQSFVHFLRMPTEMFDEILQRVGPRIAKQNTFYRNPLEPGLKLAITLRHLASGAKYRSMQYGWRVPHNTISVFIPEVCQAIIDEYVDEVMPFPSTMDDWKRIAEGFMEKWNFPHALGALDGKHVACKCPPGSGSTYFNYKKFYSIVLLALVDSDYKFIWADIGGRGAASDAQLWNASDLKSAIEDGDLDLPDAEPLPHDTEDIPYFYIGFVKPGMSFPSYTLEANFGRTNRRTDGDDAFGLRTFMQKPYGHRALALRKGYSITGSREHVEFQVLMSTMQHHPSTIRLIVTTCLVLHNLMRTRYPRLQNRLVDHEGRNQEIVPGEWRNGRQMRDCQVVQGPNRDNREGEKGTQYLETLD